MELMAAVVEHGPASRVNVASTLDRIAPSAPRPP